MSYFGLLKMIKIVVFFQIISAEFSHESEAGSSQSEMKTFMEEKGYFVHSTVTHPKNLANDYIFVKNSFD